MATSTLRAIILAGAVAIGVVGLTRAFPEGGTSPVTPPVAERTSPSPTATTPAATTPNPTTSPRVEGVVVQVLNGSGVTGLAAETTKDLEKAGYTTNEPDNANHTAATIVYFQAGSRQDAQHLLDTFFPFASLKPATQAAASDADITVILGEDASPSPSPSG